MNNRDLTKPIIIALLVAILTVLQGLSFYTLSSLKDDIRSVREDNRTLFLELAALKANIAVISARYFIEDQVKQSEKKKTP